MFAKREAFAREEVKKIKKYNYAKVVGSRKKNCEDIKYKMD